MAPAASEDLVFASMLTSMPAVGEDATDENADVEAGVDMDNGVGVVAALDEATLICQFVCKSSKGKRLPRSLGPRQIHFYPSPTDSLR